MSQIKEEILNLSKKVEKDIDSLNQSLLKNVFLYIGIIFFKNSFG